MNTPRTLPKIVALGMSAVAVVVTGVLSVTIWSEAAEAQRAPRASLGPMVPLGVGQTAHLTVYDFRRAGEVQLGFNKYAPKKFPDGSVGIAQDRCTELMLADTVGCSQKVEPDTAATFAFKNKTQKIKQIRPKLKGDLQDKNATLAISKGPKVKSIHPFRFERSGGGDEDDE